MSIPDQSDTSQLTRKQMREHQRETGAVPTAVSETDAPQAVAYPPVPPLPRPAEPAVVAPAPVPDASVDLGVSPLTRRQARQQERIRTASVPVITPEVAAAHAASVAAAASAAPVLAAPASAAPVVAAPQFTTPVVASEPEALTAASSLRSLFDTTGESPAVPAAPEPDAFSEALTSLNSGPTPAQPASDGGRPTVGMAFGSGLVGGTAAAASSAPAAPFAPAEPEVDDPFERVLANDSSGGATSASPHTLIVSQNPTAGPISAPISSTGEVLVTGTYALPEGLGSLGHVPGAADGKEVDATLVDGELPVHSSPTPIAASAAVSTAKGQDELIRPPAPEKGNKLMLTLAITAGALALALVGVLIVAFATGVFSQ